VYIAYPMSSVSFSLMLMLILPLNVCFKISVSCSAWTLLNRSVKGTF